jgi:sterol desaturase/sphingolipid hydroxylase (fatty acid hydroxylase superfamily)
VALVSDLARSLGAVDDHAGVPVSRNTVKIALSSHSGTFLAVLWATSALGACVRLCLGARSPSTLTLLAGISCFLFIVALVWHLSQADPSAFELPDISPLITPRLGFLGTLGTIIVSLGLLFVIGVALHPYIALMVAFSSIAAWTALAWRRRLSMRLVLLGLGAGLVSGLATRFVGTGDPFQSVFYLVTIPLLFIGGGLLLEHTSLAHIRLLEGRYAMGLSGFAWACVLAFPPAYLNILGGSYSRDAWVDRWWEPLYALVPGIAEETMARLFLTTLCYMLLRPVSKKRPERSVVAAVIIGSLTHGLAHLSAHEILGPAGAMMLLTGLLYGVPMAMLFIKRDLEHAVGYHFFIDFLRYSVALLQH